MNCLKCLATEILLNNASLSSCSQLTTAPEPTLKFCSGSPLRVMSLSYPSQSLLTMLFGSLQRKGGVSPMTLTLLPFLAACNLSWLLQFIALGSVALPSLAHEPWGGLLLNGNVSTPPYESKEGAWNVNVRKVKVNGVQDFYKRTTTLQWLIKLSGVQMASIFKDANYRFKCFRVTLFS